MEIAIIYLLVMNVLSFVCLRSDKKRANFSRYKIGTRTFHILSLLGGSLGVLIGMWHYRYLIDKPLFRYGVPTVLVLQILIILLLLL